MKPTSSQANTAAPIEENTGYDVVLVPFVEAVDDNGEAAALEDLLAGIESSIRLILRRKENSLGFNAELAEDLYATVILQVLERLHRFKKELTGVAQAETALPREEVADDLESEAEPPEERRGQTTITHFKALAETIARNVVHEHIRRKYPNRFSLQNQVLYVIRHAKKEKGQLTFGLWRHGFERACGFARWTGQPFEWTERHFLMRENPGALARHALPQHHGPSLKLPHMMELLFDWLDAPAEFDDTVGATARLRQVQDVPMLSLSQLPSDDAESSGTVRYEPQAPDLTPEQYTLLRASLRPLWEQIATLSKTRSTSLLLNQADAQGRPIIELLIELGVASLREIADVIEIAPPQLAELLPRLPLKDKQIAEFLGCATASVAVYRAQARKKLQEMAI